MEATPEETRSRFHAQPIEPLMVDAVEAYFKTKPFDRVKEFLLSLKGLNNSQVTGVKYNTLIMLALLNKHGMELTELLQTLTPKSDHSKIPDWIKGYKL